MLRSVRINLALEELIEAIKQMKKRERDYFVEQLLATTSPQYLESIREARADYKAGRVKSHGEVFGK